MSHRKLLPVGSNMNDCSYPFRGEYKLDERINHGHSGVVNRMPTSLACRISGANLVIEQLRTVKGADMKCELAIDGGLARPVGLAGGDCPPLEVPGDGHDYHLTAMVQGNNGSRHYCKFILNGCEGQSMMRLRAPANCPEDVLHILVDGRRIEPVAGWYMIPIHARQCQLMLNLPNPVVAPSTFLHPTTSLLREPSLSMGPDTRLTPSPSAVMQPLLLETVPGLSETAFLQCSSTGQLIPLVPYEVVAIPANSGTLRLQLPAITAERAAPPAAAVAPASTAIPSAVAMPPAMTMTTDAVPAATPLADVPTPDLETGMSVMDGRPAFVATCPGFQIRLASSTNVVAGLDRASLPMAASHAEERIQVTLTDPHGRVVLRQTTRVPSNQPPPVALRFQEDAAGMTVFSGEGSSIFVDGSMAAANGTAGTRLASDAAQHLRVEQPNPDGGRSTVDVQVSARPPAAPVSSNPFITSGGFPATPADEQWLTQLCQALRMPNLDDAKALVQHISPPNPNASTVVRFVLDQLSRTPPSIVFATMKHGIEGITCPGFNISAQIGTQPPMLVAPNGRVDVPSGANATLTAVHPQTGRPAASCVVQLHDAPAAPTPAVGDAVAARLIDCLQRHGLDPQRVMEELDHVPLATLPEAGQRLFPLLVNCLRRAMVPPEREHFLFTCCNGFLDNIYTDQPHYQVTASVDNQQPAAVPQRSRFPATGALTGDYPHFVKLIATDPQTGTTKATTTVTVMGAATQPSFSPAATTAVPPSVQHVSSAPAYPQPAAATPTPMNAALPYSTNPSYAAAPPPPPLPPAPASNTMIYLDVVLQQVAEHVQLHLVSHPQHRIVCEVDGVGGDTGRSDFTTRVDASRTHQVGLCVLDGAGQIIFQQKLTIPSMSSTSWGVALQDSGLLVDPDGLAQITTSIDRLPERTLVGNHLALDVETPHYVMLKKYVGGLHGAVAGELGLRLPGFVKVKDVEQLSQILQKHPGGENAALRQEMESMMAFTASPALRGLVTALLSFVKGGVVGAEVRPRGQVSSSSPGRVFFRLTGAD